MMSVPGCVYIAMAAFMVMWKALVSRDMYFGGRV